MKIGYTLLNQTKEHKESGIVLSVIIKEQHILNPEDLFNNLDMKLMTKLNVWL